MVTYRADVAVDVVGGRGDGGGHGWSDVGGVEGCHGKFC